MIMCYTASLRQLVLVYSSLYTSGFYAKSLAVYIVQLLVNNTSSTCLQHSQSKLFHASLHSANRTSFQSGITNWFRNLWIRIFDNIYLQANTTSVIFVRGLANYVQLTYLHLFMVESTKNRMFEILKTSSSSYGKPSHHEMNLQAS